MNEHPSPPVLLIGGGAGSGKTALARALAENIPGAGLIHLDLCYHNDPNLAPSVPRFDGPGRVVDFSNPAALDLARIRTALDHQSDAALIIVEGIFALTLPELTPPATWTVYVDTPADIRIVRKTLRKLEEGRDVKPGLLGYLASARSYARHVRPTRDMAQLVLDGTLPLPDLVAQVEKHLSGN
ncbi:zeta toxin family protein [Streptomyces sp. NBC_00513]|uniref:uridine kinase family protein n=1 Tax=unclassified Streptomyces TaxID=2593676 RepID=UPI00225BCA0A|nr:zeta toxin family protein [Streptomyces sp. NBC_00424]MCX5078651.1 zeta toxin family protein [Streptomyces sp. NBC_00424]WUD39094.1 zeta toxin family protein [Streptomyces sp. NBC_00513]WUD45635.1 zeta toxin family protein [Streptomyces sp. NBC_00513]